MDALEAIFTRRSVREFGAQQVSGELIEKILQAGMQAPSAGNQQPWHFIVIKDKGLLEAVPQICPHAQMSRDAQAAIVVCADTAIETHRGFWVQDCANATMCMLLAMHALGLGGVWCAIYPRQERVEGMQKLLGMPQNAIPLCIIPLGHPARKPEAQNRYRSERVHAEKW